MAQDLLETPKEKYLQDAGKVAAGGAPEWLSALRVAGLDAFQTTPFPHSRMEEWRHTNISSLNNALLPSVIAPLEHGLKADNLAPFFYDAPDWKQFPCVDGVPEPDLGHDAFLADGVIVSSLKQAMSGAHANIVQTQLENSALRHNAYTALNDAFLQDGVFIYIPKGVVLDAPIHLVNISSTARGASTAHIRNLIVLEEGAEARIVISFNAEAGNTNAYLNNVVQQVSLGANAGLILYKLVEEGSAGSHLDTLEINQAKDSRLKTFNATYGGRIVRNQLCVALEGAGAECDLAGLYLNDGGRLLDNALNITHHAPNCRSRIGYKGILADSSKAVFLGKVYVHPEAQGTDSDQLSNNLILGDGASIDTKPQLEIYADDVKCTHGTTVGSPPDEVIFYFRSRGIDEAVARGMLTYGFADELVEALEIPEVKESLAKLVYAKYSPKEVG